MNAICTWDFTVSSEHINLTEFKAELKEHCKKWVFQEELGELSKYQHYQGRVSLKTKTRQPSKLFKCKSIHWSITSTENRDNNFYVTKTETRINGPWSDEDIETYIPRQIREIETLRPWQKQVIENAKTWDTRSINVIHDTKGNNGKSILKTYIGVHKIGRSLPFTNDYRDMMRMVMDTDTVPLYIIDIPRALRKDQLFQFFSAIETLKDGYAYDDRYHFKEKYFDCPNIWIFMNTLPEKSYLSNDRWKFWTITEDYTLTDFDGANAVTLSQNPIL